MEREIEEDRRKNRQRRCVKSVHVWSFFGPYFPPFGLNTERYSVSLCIQSECGKIRTRKTSNMDTSHAVMNIIKKEDEGKKDLYRRKFIKDTIKAYLY